MPVFSPPFSFEDPKKNCFKRQVFFSFSSGSKNIFSFQQNQSFSSQKTFVTPALSENGDGKETSQTNIWKKEQQKTTQNQTKENFVFFSDKKRQNFSQVSQQKSSIPPKQRNGAKNSSFTTSRFPETQKQQVVSITYEEIGLFPRSFNRVFDRFFKQLFFDVENFVIQEYRFYRYLFLTTVKCLFILLFVPLSVNFLAKNYFIRPITEYFWNTQNHEIFLNSYQQKKAFSEFKNFEEKIYFESFLFSDPSNSLSPQKELNYEKPKKGSSEPPSSHQSQAQHPKNSSRSNHPLPYAQSAFKEKNASASQTHFFPPQELSVQAIGGGGEKNAGVNQNLFFASEDPKQMDLAMSKVQTAPTWFFFRKADPFLFEEKKGSDAHLRAFTRKAHPKEKMRTPSEKKLAPIYTQNAFEEKKPQVQKRQTPDATLIAAAQKDKNQEQINFELEERNVDFSPLSGFVFTKQENFQNSLQKRLQTKIVEFAKHYNEESIEAVTNFFADILSFATLWVLLVRLEIQINITKSFLLEVFFGLDDSKKSLLILFLTDLLVGYHSPNIWELFFQTFFDHYGLPESQTTIFLLVATLPVLLDVLFKYLIFRHLNRASPATVATYHAMIE